MQRDIEVGDDFPRCGQGMLSEAVPCNDGNSVGKLARCCPYVGRADTTVGGTAWHAALGTSKRDVLAESEALDTAVLRPFETRRDGMPLAALVDRQGDRGLLKEVMAKDWVQRQRFTI